MNREQLTIIVENKSTIDSDFYRGFVAMGNLLLEDDDLIMLTKSDFTETAKLDFYPNVRKFTDEIIVEAVKTLDDEKVKHLAVDKFTDLLAESLLEDMGMNDD